MNPVLRILVVEDDDVLRRLNTEVLTDSGYKVDAAQDGAVAWTALQIFDYDLLITDFNVPNLSGLDLLKKLCGARMALPVIMVSGNMPAAELNRQPWLQIDAALLKPHTHAELLATVRSVLPAPARVGRSLNRQAGRHRTICGSDDFNPCPPGRLKFLPPQISRDSSAKRRLGKHPMASATPVRLGFL